MKIRVIFFTLFIGVFTQNELEIGEEIQRWEDYKVRRTSERELTGLDGFS
jgi:hypothetical protein